MADTSQPFTGHVKLIDNDFLAIDDLFSKTSGLCVTGSSGEWECNYRENHSPQDKEDYPNLLLCTSWTYWVSLEYGPCPETIDAGDSTGGGTSIGDGDTGGGGTGSGGASTVPTKPCDGGTNNIEGKNNIEDDNGDCLEDLGKRKECKKITDFINASENQAFKNKLTELSGQPNLNLDKEKSVSSFENETALDERIGTADNPSVAIQSNPTNKYKAFVHTHPNIGDGTLSVFSPTDLTEIARIINNGKITNGFVAFLTTKKGTQYALTINNPTKFVDLFYSQLFDNVSDVMGDPVQALQNKDRFYASQEAYQPLFKEYFDPKNPNVKIKNTDTEPEDVLKEFLNFMDEADAGFTLFDASSTQFGESSFTSFRKIRLKNGEIERDYTCN
ncbi:hypothetical protein [Winogradskyella sp. UBA3174]|uniref:hypothetical protein n=1 Tax=Winogradskyella sp. UBA3174 TaxID=1947785 RepID=UPI0025D385C0|nr:hypothetical protein [Winogradskyella sp. UBA3174]